MRALLLIAPLLIFVLVTFVSPIVDMLFRSVENGIVTEILPHSTSALKDWNSERDELPGEAVFRGLYVDMVIAVKRRQHTRVGSRLNYEAAGIASVFRKTGRSLRKVDVDAFVRHFTDLHPDWENRAFWEGVFSDPAAAGVLPNSSRTFDAWSQDFAKPEDPVPEDFVYVALAGELRGLDASDLSGFGQPYAGMLAEAARTIGRLDEISLKQEFLQLDSEWSAATLWKTIKIFSPPLTEAYFLNAVDMKKGIEGVERKSEAERIYLVIFGRTFVMSVTITLACIFLGYPVAYFLARLPLRKANLFLILVLLPFWTSLLVRTSAWKVLLQQEGVINDILVAVGIVDDSARLVMINNQFGTIVAMTHILLPFMILPLFSVMKTIPPDFVRAAKSLGADAFTAFRRVYFPQSLPGIGAGSVLVFILAIGYYITPELVGGIKGTFISNRIAYHISTSLNWGLAAALGTLLLMAVLLLYWVYDRIVGIDNVKLG